MTHELVYVIFTAVAVSADSLFAGFGLSLGKKSGLMLPSLVALITFLLCLAAWSARFATGYLGGKLPDVAGAAVLCLTGVCNLFKKDDRFDDGKQSLAQCVAVGFAVGLDAAIANLSLVFLGFDTLEIPLFFAAMHFVTVGIGQILANFRFTENIRHTNVLSGVLLIALGVVKLF